MYPESHFAFWLHPGLTWSLVPWPFMYSGKVVVALTGRPIAQVNVVM